MQKHHANKMESNKKCRTLPKENLGVFLFCFVLLSSCLLCYCVFLVLNVLLFLATIVFTALLFLTKLVFTRATKKGASKKGATAPFKLGGHPVQRLIGKRKWGKGEQHRVLWGDGTEEWAPASDVKKAPELIRAFEKLL